MIISARRGIIACICKRRVLVLIGNRQCLPTCPSLEKPNESTALERRDELKRIAQLRSRKVMHRGRDLAPPPTCKANSDEDKVTFARVNEKILARTVNESIASDSAGGSADEANTNSAFQLLEKSLKITKRYCKAAHVPSTFLSQALKSLKILHQELKTLKSEVFSAEEYRELYQLLAQCQWEVPTLHMNTNGCSKEQHWVSVAQPRALVFANGFKI